MGGTRVIPSCSGVAGDERDSQQGAEDAGGHSEEVPVDGGNEPVGHRRPSDAHEVGTEQGQGCGHRGTPGRGEGLVVELTAERHRDRPGGEHGPLDGSGPARRGRGGGPGDGQQLCGTGDGVEEPADEEQVQGQPLAGGVRDQHRERSGHGERGRGDEAAPGLMMDLGDPVGMAVPGCSRASAGRCGLSDGHGLSRSAAGRRRVSRWA